MRKSTAQEAFWRGAFGNEYTERNRVRPADRAPFFARILSLTAGVGSVCELGANRGHNLTALHSLDPGLALTGVEVNGAACEEMASLGYVRAVNLPLQQYQERSDLVFTCGVLIHLAPADFPAVYHHLANLSNRYVLLNEYFNPTPVEVPYRGHTERLFKRDFGGEFLDARPDFRLVDYGFLWKRTEPAWDNSTWWLLERSP